jgi:hypothetical protein
VTTTYDDDEPGGQQNDSSVISELRRKLRESEKSAHGNAEAAARAEAAERELAFLKAGVDPAKPAATWFIKGYDGDLSTDAIKKAAGDAGLLASAPTPGGVDASHQVAAIAQGAIDAATAGPFGGVSPVNHLENMQRALERGGIDAMADYMRTVGLPVAGDDQ